MMQDYDFHPGPSAASIPTSAESVSIDKPSRQAIENIKAYARSLQTLEIEGIHIRICLN